MAKGPCPGACGCCEPPEPAAPALIYNRPGLAEIAWRTGTYATYRQATLDALASGPDAPPGVDEGRWRQETRAALAGLTSRDDGDYAVMLLGLFAAIGDVLSFYSERIANEMFLRTARERDSLLRLVRLIGFRPAPGLSATTALAFTLNAGASTRIRQGLKVMSVPGQDERPQVFETLAEIVADARLNDLPLYGAPQPVAPFAAGLSRIPILSRPETLLRGDTVAIVGGDVLEMNAVQSLDGLADGETLTLTKPVGAPGAASVGFRLLRELKFFGNDAPDSYPFYDANPAVAPALRWSVKRAGVDYSVALAASLTRYALDRSVDDLKPGALLLADRGAGTANRYAFALVTATESDAAALGPLSATVTYVHLQPVAPMAGADGLVLLAGQGLPAIADLRKTRLYELARPAIVPRGYVYPDALMGGTAYVRADHVGDPALLVARRRIAIADGSSRHVAALVDVATLPAGGDGVAHVRIGFAPPLPAAFSAPRMNANVAPASHGETQPDETLGHGDASRPFQRFKLQRSRLSRLTGLEPAPELAIRVNGELWDRAPSFFARGPTDRVYTVREDDGGVATITFGDGRTGARLPSGASNVTARYRIGLGTDGRVRADQLSTLLERPPGLRDVTNPVPAAGDADPGTLGQAREAAPGTVRTFGRAIALDDFAAVARQTGLAAVALATWAWIGLERAIHLTVAGAEGARLDADALAALHAALDGARDPNALMLLGNLWRTPVVVAARVLRDRRYEAETIGAAARAALIDFLSFARQPPGRPLHLSQIMAALQSAAGVAAVDVDLFRIKGSKSWTAAQRARRGATADPVQANIRIFAARPRPPAADLDPLALAGLALDPDSPVLPAEQAYVEAPATDIALTVVDSL